MICVIANARHTPDSIDRFENGVARRSSRGFWIYSPEHLRFRMQVVVLALSRDFFLMRPEIVYAQ
jgi:hypothetical protein